MLSNMLFTSQQPLHRPCMIFASVPIANNLNCQIGELYYQITLASKINTKLMVVVHKNEESLQETPLGRETLQLLN
jgi:hypothetical protein